MYFVTLSEAKKQLNLEPYFIDDDSYISSLIDVSFYSIKNYCRNSTWVDVSGVTGNTDYPDSAITGTTIPLVVKQAILLMVSNFYANREPVSFATPSKIPYTLEFLLSPYINYHQDKVINYELYSSYDLFNYSSGLFFNSGNTGI